MIPVRAESLPPFLPHPLLRSGHAMTLAGALLPRSWGAFETRVEARVFQVDETTRVIARCSRAEGGGSRPTLVLVHGLCGSALSRYMIGTAQKAHAAGFDTVRLNMRNCGGTEHLTPTVYHAGLTTDLAAVLRELIDVDGRTEIYCAGFSLGGNVLLKMLGELGERAGLLVRGAVAVSAPIDLAACADAIERGGLNGLYQRRFIRSLRTIVQRKHELFPERYSTEGLDSIRSIREFDDRVTAPHSGFGTAENYYRAASALRFIPAIRVPTYMISAADDTMIPAEALSRAEVRGNPFVHTLVTERGGHVAFLARRPARWEGGEDADVWWVENRVVQIVRGLSAGRPERD